LRHERVRKLNDISSKPGKYVLYWMQASQRVEENHALELAKGVANDLSLPLIVLFVLYTEYPSANSRSFTFMLEGLLEVSESLRETGIDFLVVEGEPVQSVSSLALEAAVLVTDTGYLRHQINWREALAEKVDCPFFCVESNVVIPVGVTSQKEEYSAATIRPKVHKSLNSFISDFEPVSYRTRSMEPSFGDLPTVDLKSFLQNMRDRNDVPPIRGLKGGTEEATRRLDDFLNEKLDEFPSNRNDPNLDGLSNMSPYLHFAQISPSFIARRVAQSQSPGSEAYLEELVVRRELSMNFAFYNKHYDSFSGLPAWAKKTLDEHRRDSREYLYSLDEFESARTHDEYWNAAQLEMIVTGKMHGYMRMYWGKKILEWSRSPEEALKIAVYLNDRYELDGRDPNGYAGIMWCLGKHDRAWAERKVMGKIRYMNDRGLRRKFDADNYVRKIKKLVHSL